MGALRSYWRLPWRHKLTTARVSVLVVGVRMALRVLPYRTVQRLLTLGEREASRSTSALAPEALRARRQRIASAVASTGKHLLGDKPCLTQALVAQRLLRRQGYDTDLCIGVTKDGNELLAHAWLEKDGRVILGGRASQAKYTPLVPVRPEPA